MPYFSRSANTDTLNKLDSYGKRVGYWVLSQDNKPVSLGSTDKVKEGNYLSGRKSGVWINYYSDGVSPRLIGEYSDNRPSGAYFRFNRNGELIQASSVPKRIEKVQAVEASNKIFKCKMYFSDKEVVAGQVYFSNKVMKKNTAVQFWVEKSLEVIASKTKVIDFTWLNTNYERLYSTYLKVRTPKSVLIKETQVEELIATTSNTTISKFANKPYFRAPLIVVPKVAKGLVFDPNGLNKLYTESDEIWMDGFFSKGQLVNGKVFVYDKDGVLLKVRVYKNGLYDSDGVL